MLCTNCKKEKAVFFYSQTINGNESSVALCKNCSGKVKSNGGIGIFDSFFNSNTKDTAEVKKCNLCGLSFSDIKKLGKVGCPECYKTFSDSIDVIVKQIHGTAKHCGSTPADYVASTEKVTIENEENLLKSRLNEAIIAENYEEAAIIRDKIKALKGEEK